jgi:hypothetical protein
MTNRLLLLGACAAAFLGLTAQDVAAQDDRAGTQAMEELLVPITPRTVALGSAITGGLGDLSGVEAVQSNPAALLSSTGTGAMFSRTQYVEDIGINYAGVSQRFGANSIAITLLSWDYGDIERTTEDNPDNPAGSALTYNASAFALGATLGRQFTDRIGAGFTLKTLGRQIDNVGSNGIAFDAGITYVVEESGLRFGVALKNLGGQMGFSGTGLNRQVPISGPGGSQPVAGEIRDLEAQLPSTLNFGASYTRQFEGNLSVSALGNFQSLSYDLDQFSGGLEVGYNNLVYARGGVNVSSDPSQDMWQSWNLGGGLNLDLGSTKLRVDYAYRPTNVFGSVNVFSVGLGL